jgi:uncharacterized integral membrane protein
MKIIINLLISLVIAIWIGAIAVFSIQNIQGVSIKFITFESISLPIGVMLALSASFGMLIGAILPLFWQKSTKS